MMKKILAAAMMFLAAGPAMAQEWTLSTELGDLPIEALAVAPDGTVWAGQSNSIYRFDGASWSVVTTVTGWTEVEFFGAYAPANDRAYFSGWGKPPVGGAKASCHPSIYLPIVLRKTGGAGKSLSWWEVGFQEPPWCDSAHLWATANGSGGYDVWAAAWDGIYKSSNDGASWVSFSDPGIGYYSDIDGTGTSDIWVAGVDSANYNACLYHYNGSSWTLHTSGGQGSTPKICAPSGAPPCCAFTSSTMIGTESILTTPVFEFSGGAWVSLTELPRHSWPYASWSPQSHYVWLGTTFRESTSSPETGGVFSYDGTNWWMQTTLPEPVWSVDASCPGVVWATTTGAVYYCGQPPAPGQRKPWQTDFNGDGTSDIGVFRNTTGMWAIRGVTRIYFGASSDSPVPGDFSGNGTTDVGVFRNTTGMWAIRGVTRVYFGTSSDSPVAGDYSGDGTADVGIFRNASGLWAVRGVFRYDGSEWSLSTDLGGLYVNAVAARNGEAWAGTESGDIFHYDGATWTLQTTIGECIRSLDAAESGDNWAGGDGKVYRLHQPLSQPWRTDYDGDGTADVGIFRDTTGLWAIRRVTRLYFGGAADSPVPGDFSGNGTTDVAVFRNATGLWAIRGVTRLYFGSSDDIPHPGDYTGDGTVEPAVFRPASGLWAVRGATRAYFGMNGDLQVPGYYGGGRAVPGIFRYSTGLWAIRGATRLYFGGAADDPAPGDYAGEGSWRPAVFRPSSGLWAVKGVTRLYFGTAGDRAVPGGYGGGAADLPAVFRPTSGLWAVRGFTRLYFGGFSDITVSR